MCAREPQAATSTMVKPEGSRDMTRGRSASVMVWNLRRREGRGAEGSQSRGRSEGRGYASGESERGRGGNGSPRPLGPRLGVDDDER